MADRDYEIGYGKPPKSRQFQKGQSGNAGGVRKRPLTLEEEIMRQLNRRVPLPTRNGKKETMPVRELIARRLVQLAADSDLKAIKMIAQLDKVPIANAPAVQEAILDIRLCLDDQNSEHIFEMSRQEYEAHIKAQEAAQIVKIQH